MDHHIDGIGELYLRKIQFPVIMISLLKKLILNISPIQNYYRSHNENHLEKTCWYFINMVKDFISMGEQE